MRSDAMRWLIGVVMGVSALLGASHATAAIHIKRIQYNPPGKDQSHPDDEFVVVRNTGDQTVRMRYWVLEDQAGHEFTFPRFHLPAGQVVWVHSGTSYFNTRHHVFWHSPFPVWNNHGDTATLMDDHGNLIDRCRYSGGGRFALC